MSEETWTAEIARGLAESRREVQRVVPEVPEDAWSRESGYAGWTFKDQLGHLPESHLGLQGVLKAVVAGGEPDFSRFLKLDELNEENRKKHLSTPVETLLADFIEASEATERLVSELKPEHEDVKFGPLTIGIALQGFVMHDRGHLDEMRLALNG